MGVAGRSRSAYHLKTVMVVDVSDGFGWGMYEERGVGVGTWMNLEMDMC